jgi:ATP-dependent Clp protease ATP-binding subunit ClpC
MFERFTDRARRALVLAQDEARLLNHNFIGTEHLLLGLAREDDGVAAKALASLGIRLDAVRQKVAETAWPAGTSSTSSPPFTPRAKRVLELSLREALQLGHNYIGTEHILLGLVREGDAVAAQVLVGLGADLARVRQQVLDLLGASPAHGAAQQAGAAFAAPVGPRCGRCGAGLAGSLRYASAEARPADEQAEQGRGTLSVTVFYCGHCGAVLGPPLDADAVLGGPVARTAHLGGSVQGGAGGPSAGLASDPLGPVSVEDVPESARVKLVFHDNELVEGTIAGAEVHLSGPVRARGGSVKGTWGGVALGTAWRIGDKQDVPPTGPLPVVISGRFGGAALKLQGDVQLGPHLSFERAGVSGDLCGQSLRAEVSAADGGLGTTSAVVAEGTLGEAPFELFAALSDDGKRAIVRGSVGGQPVSLDATGVDPAASVCIVGTYIGEPALLALVLGVIIHFL